jgi:protein-S-isoprenylcysteine O-methyltransferase Ste14
MSKLVQTVADATERMFVVVLAIPFLWAFAKAMPTHPNVILTAASEMLAVVFILTRKRGDIAVGLLPILVAFAGSALPLMVRPVGTHLIPTLACSILMGGGLGLSVASKLYLNRSFGLVAANRGVKVGGPYRFVRHPMYLGYIINQLGFLMANFTGINLALYLAAWAFQLIRVREEERVLLHDEHYQRFADRVGSRLIPGVY